MTMRVKDVIRESNPVCETKETLASAMVKMTESRLGLVTLVDDKGAVAGVFTDGDLRRKLQADGRGILDKTLAAIGFSKVPHTLDRESLLNDAVKLFKKAEVDSIVVVDGARPVGVLDVQDLIKLGLLGQEHL
jgi:signal-transduction protein with cAMP-binding, CBS, and nucleotidyltransferase domain